MIFDFLPGTMFRKSAIKLRLQLITNRKSNTGFQFVQKSVTLNGQTHAVTSYRKVICYGRNVRLMLVLLTYLFRICETETRVSQVKCLVSHILLFMNNDYLRHTTLITSLFSYLTSGNLWRSRHGLQYVQLIIFISR